MLFPAIAALHGMFASPSVVGLSGTPTPPPDNRYWTWGVVFGVTAFLLLRLA